MSDQSGHPAPTQATGDHQFWQNLQVYHTAIKEPEAQEVYRARALDTLVSLPVSNLRFLSSKLGVLYDQEEDLPQPLAWKLMQSEHSSLLTCLAEYLRRRISYVGEFFDRRFPEADSNRIQADITEKSRGGRDTIKPFTKLYCIYSRNPGDLELIHYEFAWRRTPTYAEFDVQGGMPDGAIEKLQQAIPQLLKNLDGIKIGETYGFFGAKALRPGMHVFVVHRNYQTAVKPDHRKIFRSQHDYTQIAFGINERSELSVRVENRAITDAISGWVRQSLGVELTMCGGALFKDYEGDRVSRSFMGEYEESHGIDLVSIAFKHSVLPGGSPLILSASEFNRSVREELRWLRERGVLRLSSLADIDTVTVRYGGIESKIECHIERGGAIRFHLIDAALSDEHVSGIKAAFQEAFQVPIGQIIDPTMMTMGATEIYHHLLSGVEDHQVHGYQRQHLHRLIKLDLLDTVNKKQGECTNVNCINKSQKLDDETLTECPSCQKPLSWTEHKHYKLKIKTVVRSAKDLLQEISGLKLSPDVHMFESHAVHRLYWPKRPSKFIHVFFNERLKSGKIEVFKRAMFPIMIVHPTGSQRAPVIDEDGIAHVGFAHALAAKDDPVSMKAFRKATRTIIRRLRQMEQERILKAARHSRDSLAEKAHGYNDRMFESDVYNLMRRMFPHSIKMGGANKPDGFSSLIYFKDGDLSDPTKVNLSYDAKYSDDTYDFGIKEHRQMHEYIRSLSRSKQLQREGNRHNGHIIIFNNIKESSMQGAADYLHNIDRLPQTHPGFLLIFMHDGFLVRLWDSINDYSAEIATRWYALPEVVHTTIQTSMQNGYTLLDAAAATAIIDEIRRQPASENPINYDSLLLDIKSHVKQRTNRPSKRLNASSN